MAIMITERHVRLGTVLLLVFLLTIPTFFFLAENRQPNGSDLTIEVRHLNARLGKFDEYIEMHRTAAERVAFLEGELQRLQETVANLNTEFELAFATAALIRSGLEDASASSESVIALINAVKKLVEQREEELKRDFR